MRNNQIPKKDKIKLFMNALNTQENQDNQDNQEVNYIVHPLMMMHETAPELFRGCTMSKAFFHNMFQLAMMVRTRNMQNEVTGVTDPLLDGASKILEMFMNQTVIELMQEEKVQKWTEEQWKAEEAGIMEIIKKAYAQTEAANPPQNEAKSPGLGVEQPESVKPTEEKPAPKIYMSKDEL